MGGQVLLLLQVHQLAVGSEFLLEGDEIFWRRQEGPQRFWHPARSWQLHGCCEDWMPDGHARQAVRTLCETRARSCVQL